MDGLVQLGSALIIITALLLSNRTENFSSEIASIGSVAKNDIPADSGLPLFLNFYPRFGPDFRLFDLIQKLKLNNSSPMWNGIYKKGSGSRSLLESKKLPPVILVPGLGASPLFARWNKSSTDTVQTVDASGDFQQPDAWSCKQVQDTWVQIWPPDSDGLNSYCWANNTRVVVDGLKVVNATGVNTINQEFGSLKFANEDYMSTLVDALEAVGYVKGENLFAACYDFRKIGDPQEIDAWCMSLTKLIEQNCALQENPAIVVGHDLGAVVANYFLVGAMQEWKDKFIDKFVSVSGSFGGCPKALRAVLSGVSGSENFNTAVQTSSGLSLMLPNPMLYGDNPLIQFNQLSYTSRDIPKLVESVSEDAAKVLKLSKMVRDTSMKAPGVEVHILAGTDLNTESSYSYGMSLTDEPGKNAPFYKLDLPYNQKFNYNDQFTGDGTMPKFALEYPIFWSKYQSQPVYFQFFTGCEHTKILSTLEPIQYILNACSD